MNKDKGMRIRCTEKERKAFSLACRSNHETAAAVLRKYMRQYAKRNGMNPA